MAAVETDAAGVRKTTEYFLLGQNHLYSLTQVHPPPLRVRHCSDPCADVVAPLGHARLDDRWLCARVRALLGAVLLPGGQGLPLAQVRMRSTRHRRGYCLSLSATNPCWAWIGRLSTSFLTASWVAGVVSTLTYCAAFATYSFW